MINEALAEEVRESRGRREVTEPQQQCQKQDQQHQNQWQDRSAGLERRSHRTRPESKEENAHEVSIVDGQRQLSAKGEETNPRWRIEDAS